jgi:uncharacterized protein (TIGR04222 family)
MALNPFDWTGPHFLMFYLVFAVLVSLIFHWKLKQKESEGEVPDLSLGDPYEIAYLRGGKDESLRVATFSLIDRNLLTVKDQTLKTLDKGAKELVKRPIERAILAKYETAGKSSLLFVSDSLELACDKYRAGLKHRRLIAGPEVFSQRTTIFLIALGALFSVAGTKMAVAISRDRSNLWFLLILAGIAAIPLVIRFSRNRTGLGDRALSDLQTLFSGLASRVHMLEGGGQTNEATLLAAVFGLSSLKAPSFAYVKRLFPRAKRDGSSGSSGCGSCASSSGGASCGGGSSCGGGGSSCGGGGCGGCGGS